LPEESASRGGSEAASRVLESAKDAVLSTAEAQKAGGADRLDGLSKAVHEAADDLGHEMPKAASYIHAMADRLGDASASLRNRNIEELVGTVNDFARRQPAASFVGAMVAGFALSRLLKSTSGTDAARTDQP
jgi:hypothetical protein